MLLIPAAMIAAPACFTRHKQCVWCSVV